MYALEAMRYCEMHLNHVENPHFEARLLMAHILKQESFVPALHQDTPLTKPQIEKLHSLIERRMRHEPIAYLIGKKPFWKADFIVTNDVLIPRPESELMIEAALSLGAQATLLELGVGSGAILASLLGEWQGARAVGCDISRNALKIAQENCKALGVDKRVELVFSNWFLNIKGQFDLILANPPYISKEEMNILMPDVRDYEPRCALTDEKDGLEAYRIILKEAKHYLKAGGHLILEHGAHQSEEIITLSKRYHWKLKEKIKDLSHHNRHIIFQI